MLPAQRRRPILGDSLSSTEGRTSLVPPWPMLLQDALGRDSYVVHGFGLPAISAAAYGGQQVYRSAASLRPAFCFKKCSVRMTHIGALTRQRIAGK